ncbi:cystathionine gamma-synthase [Schizosaccharomyces cryophilus OY26]|uniref:cystathionine gamma-synthase n=1 Tax=Schizosaccharomyces cryophilus (strain OY26 / ATCC MYA-4695 / CBS 11777 / NBRC 106824 / NRRL Y48691) TaxID=653667 RepID=S9W875_SCHCR|nr:cystathionine gamma-synthase [Schizosaccharomyces cryophilus OY26]EPY53955.1 cystathionine gamma-synthase [Schizosaccharomyces cryophilus OY26]
MSLSLSYLVNPPTETGSSIPADTDHAISVTLPTWQANVGYEEGDPSVITKMQTGYPRFFINTFIKECAAIVKRSPEVQKLSLNNYDTMLYPSKAIGQQCVKFIAEKAHIEPSALHIFDASHSLKLYLKTLDPHHNKDILIPDVFAVLFPSDLFGVAKQFWQHTGEGISSRRAVCFLHAYRMIQTITKEGSYKQSLSHLKSKSRSRYASPQDMEALQNWMSSENQSNEAEMTDVNRYLEERYGRNLDLSLATSAKIVLRRRIAGTLEDEVDLKKSLPREKESELRQIQGLTHEDVYLFPTGMSSIYNAHRILRNVLDGTRKSVCFGFCYVDTLKILEKWGAGCHFYGLGNGSQLDEFEKLLESGEKVLGLFCEFPSNPLLNTPDLVRIRQLADKYDFAVVVDETIGNFLNVEVLPYADMVVSSLTKIFSGDSNVMGGSLVLNPLGRYYGKLKEEMPKLYEDNFYDEDALTLERNSRDFADRSRVINENAEVICDLLLKSPKVKQLYYPKYNASSKNYEICKRKNGGYGGLLSVIFHNPSDARHFYDHIRVAKGPSLGTNFTLASPYTIIAHYQELDWAEENGINRNLVRVSVGMEPKNHISAVFSDALN